MIYTLTLNPALDYDIYLDELKKGDLNLSKKCNLRAGGKGINVSYMLSNLECNSYVITLAGGLGGQYIENSLNESKIPSKIIKVEGNTRINVKINDNYEETEIAGLGTNISDDNLEEIFEEISKLNKEDILALCGSIPSNLKTNIYKEISKRTNAKIVLDTRGDILFENLYNNLLIKPNIKELEQAFNTTLDSDEKIYEYCKDILDKGVKNIIVSKGKEGALLIKKGKFLKATIPNGKYINSIGAGDSMVAGFIYSYINKFSDEDTLRFAVACGSSTAYSYGIGELNLVNNLKNEIKIMEVNI